jgi:PAS domain S-box-containing protein
MKPSAVVSQSDSHAKARRGAVILIAASFIASLIAVIYSFTHASKLPVVDQCLHVALFAILSFSAGLYLRSHRLRSAPNDMTGGRADADPAVAGDARLVFDMLPAFVWTAAPDGTFEYLNQEIQTYTGRTLQELRDDPTSVLHPDDLESRERDWQRMLRAGEPMERELRYRGADGVYRWFQTRSRPVRDNSGRVLRWHFVTWNIEGHRGAEQAFKANELALRQLLEGLPCQIAAAEPDGRHSYANRRMLDYCGMTLADAKDSGWLGIIHPEDRPAVAAEWIRCGAAREPMDVNHRLRRHDGVYRWFNARVEPFLDDRGHIVRWYGVITDIHDARLMEDALRTIRERLAEASKLATVGELSASIAHEINQPLSAVVSNGDACVRWLNSSPPNIERARNTAQMIVRDAKSAADVVRRVRALFKHTDSDRAPLDANEVIREVLHLMQGEIISKGIDVSADLGGEIPPVFADRVHVQQILINLVQNGIDAMDGIRDRPKTLVLRSHIQEPRFVAIQVKDSGSGIPDPVTIFEPFFSTKEKGLGVGLSICRSIVEAHAGQLWARADEGGGSTFEFTLPVHEMVIP